MKKVLLILFLVAAVAVAFVESGLSWQALRRGDWLEQVAGLKQTLQGSGWRGGVIYLALFAVLPLAMVPVSALFLAAGIVFRPLEAGLLMWSGSLLCTVVSFLLGRYLGRSVLDRLFRGRLVLLEKLDEHSGRHGFKACLLSRFLPFPFAFAGYAAGMTSIRLTHLVAATALTMLPWSVLYAVFGQSLTAHSVRSLSGLFALGAFVLAASWYARRWATRQARTRS
jgi:uncharacterized membrane protein YdjX (TVP38/TMEM64 family)